MKDYKIIIADLDGTLIKTISGETFSKGIWDMQLRFDVLDKIKEMSPSHVIIVSNQGGIEKGFVAKDAFCAKIEYVAHSIKEYCKCECCYSYCPSNNKYHPDRKPNTGMIEHLIKHHVDDYDTGYIKAASLMIGDASGKPNQFSDSDKKTAENFGCDYMDVEDFVKH